MKAVFIDVQRPIESKLIDPNSSSQNVGDSAISRLALLTKPRREFTFKSWDTLMGPQAEIIRNWIHMARITGVFALDGDHYGIIEEPIFIAEGNGVQKEYPLPFDNVYPSSWKIWVGTTLNTGWTMKPNSGILVFSSAPTGRITGIGKRWFRVAFDDQEASLLNESQVYSSPEDQVYSLQPITLIEVEGVDVS